MAKPLAPERLDGAAMALRGAQRRPPKWSGESRYSRSIAILRYLVPATAVGLVLTVMIWPQVQKSLVGAVTDTTNVTQEMAQTLVMINPRYQGFDEKQHPFNVTAASAIHSSDNAEVVELEKPQADLSMADGSWVAVSAEHGRYDREGQKIVLSGAVEVFQDQGFQLNTPIVNVDLKAGLATSDQPTTAQGPTGFLESSGFRFTTDGKKVLFTGPAHLTIYELAADDPAAAPKIPE